MPKHHFSFSEETRRIIGDKIDAKLAAIKQSRFGNEPNFTPAMVQALSDFTYENDECTVKIEGAVMTSVGRKSVEKPSGADCSIVATITDTTTGKTIQKGILAQCKKGKIEDMPVKEKVRLDGQIEKMRNIVSSPKVIETPMNDGDVPTIVSGNGILSDKRVQKQTFGRWIARRVMPTFDGDTSEGIAEKVLDASLTSFKLQVTKHK